jgi:L-ribulose-5-phosphate 3-epimerase
MADSLSLAGWSLVRRFRATENPLALLDFPRVAREEFGFDAIELNSPFFASLDSDYLDELSANAAKAKVRLLGIAVDRMGDLAALDPVTREEAVQRHIPWLEAGALLDCAFVRVNLGGHDAADPEAAVRAGIASFGALAQAAGERGVTLVIENHWGLSADPANMVRIITTVNDARLGALLDFGNFPDDIRYDALARIAPYARTVHAKFKDFDTQGKPLEIDVARCVSIVRDAGYVGNWGIEYEGQGDDHDGVVRSKQILSHLLGLH